MLQKFLHRFTKLQELPLLHEAFRTGYILVFLLPFSIILYKLYIPHINSFGCFDECLNYIGGYFLLHGRSLYSQIFFNHQPFMAYASFLVLKFFHPANMFEMLLRYKQVLLFTGLVADFFIIRRFKWAGIGFTIIFELTKYYLFGDKFLAESFLVYPLVYMTGLILYKFENKKIYAVEYIFASIFTWIVIFSREPYIPVAIAVLVILLGFSKTRIQKISYVLFVSVTIVTFLLLPLQEYFYQVFTINSQGVGAADAQSTQLLGIGFFHVFLYPLFLFIQGQFNELRIVEIGMSVVFFVSAGYMFLKKKQRATIGIFLLLLGLANLRPIPSGELFYSAFHFTAWWGMFILGTLIFLTKMKYMNKLIFYLGLIIIIGCTGSYVVFSKSFIHYHVDTQSEFAINFGNTYALGNVVKILSTPKQTFFIDHEDDVDVAYMESGRVSPYKYSDYGFVAPNFVEFQKAYGEMFATNLPDFYYGEHLPKDVLDMYQVVLKESKPSKLYIKKTVYNTISKSTWESVQRFGYTKE